MLVAAAQTKVITVGSALAGETLLPVLKNADASNKLVLAPGEAVRT